MLPTFNVRLELLSRHHIPAEKAFSIRTEVCMEYALRLVLEIALWQWTQGLNRKIICFQKPINQSSELTWPGFSSIFRIPDRILLPTVPATQYPGMIIMFFSFVHHFLKISRDKPPCSIPGVANTTIGPGFSIYALEWKTLIQIQYSFIPWGICTVFRNDEANEIFQIRANVGSSAKANNKNDGTRHTHF